MAKPTRTQVHIDRAMTRVSIARRNESYIAGEVFPTVPVQNQSDKYFVFDRASWFRNEAGPRAPGTRGPEVEYSISSSTYACRPVSATKTVPDEIVANADVPLQPMRDATDFVTDKVMLYVEVDVASEIFGGANWSASGANSGTSGSLQWNLAASEPLEQVEVMRETIIKGIGRQPNVLLMGREVYTDLRNHPDILDRIKYTSPGVVTPDILKSLFQVGKLLIGDAIYTTAADGASATYSYIWGKNVWLGWVPTAAGLMIPAPGYVLSWKTRTIERFRREEEKTFAFRCEMNYDCIVTCPDAGFELKTAVA